MASGRADSITSTHTKAPQKTRAPRIPENLPVVREEPDPPEVLLDPNDFRRIGEGSLLRRWTSRPCDPDHECKKCISLPPKDR